MNDLNKVLAFDIGTKKISCLAAIKSKESEVTMKEDLDNLKGEINEIKSLLKELVRGN